MAFVENFDVYFATGTPGVYAAVLSGTLALNVEFEADFYETFREGFAEGFLPRIGCAESAAAGIALGQTIQITEGDAAGTYVVRQIHGRGSGILSLRVEKQ